MADRADGTEEERERERRGDGEVDSGAAKTTPTPDPAALATPEPSAQTGGSADASRTASMDEEAEVVRAEVARPRAATITNPPTLLPPALPPLPPNTHAPDSPTTELISTLRTQIALLTDASSQLNTKLVGAVSRVGDLEDALDAAQRARTQQDALVGELEAQKAQWEESMNTGLLVERGQIKDEMQRLVDGLVEEERRRGSAEEGRQRVEREVDDLSASLFEQANTMVAAERLHRVQAESRLKAAEDNLSVAEAAVQSMQQHLQSLPSLLLPAPELSSASKPPRRRHLAGTLPHAEFLAFLHHLRMAKPQHAINLGMLPPPLVSALLAQPFLARTMAEDHDPTLRLDAAPDLSWLSRRSANAAILAGELAIEPVSAATLLASAQYAGASGEIACSMCGKAVFPQQAVAGGMLPPPVHGAGAGGTAKSGGLSPSAGTGRFSLKPFFNSNSPTAASTPRASPGGSSPLASPSITGGSAPPVYVFRIGTASSSSASASSGGAERDTRMYPLCHSGWCLGRLRATCELWRFVRSGMVDVIWKGEDGWVPPIPAQRKSMPALPPRKRSQSRGVKPVSADSDAEAEARGKRASDMSALGLSSIPPAPASAPAAAAAAGERPELPARKRSGWGLGFKFGSRNSSGQDLAVAKGDSSASDKEQESPGAEKVELAGEDKMDVEVREVTDHGVETVAEGQAVATSDEVVAEEPQQAEEPNGVAEEAGSSDHLGAPEDGRSGAASPAVSTASDLEGEGFSTPKGQSPGAGQTELPPVEVGKASDDESVAAIGDSSTDRPTLSADEAAELNAVDLASPRSSADLERRPVPPLPTAESSASLSTDNKPTPPPIPRRAPNRTSVDLSNGPLPVPDTQTPVIETIPEGEAAPGVADGAAAPHTPQPDADPSEMVTPKPAAGNAPESSPAPALPPRSHARTSSSMPAGPHASRYVEGDDWETKTWREIVRLKEEMWMARLGVVAGDDPL